MTTCETMQAKRMMWMQLGPVDQLSQKQDWYRANGTSILEGYVARLWSCIADAG